MKFPKSVSLSLSKAIGLIANVSINSTWQSNPFFVSAWACRRPVYTTHFIIIFLLKTCGNNC